MASAPLAPTTPVISLPDEILQQIFFQISPADTLLNIQRTSKRFARLGNEPLIWRHHCRTCYKYWDSKHRITQKFTGSVSDVDWKKLYFYRQQIDHRTTDLLNSILSEQIGRIAKFEMIGSFGYDAKDTLLRHCHASEATEDVLARQYYSNAVLDHLHRSKALEEWSRLSNGVDIALERALGAFDMFVLHDELGDLEEISHTIDDLVCQMQIENPILYELSPRQRALAVATFLRKNELTGISSELRYRDLKNNYIGVALRDEEHPSLPLISVVIFCALAQRVGLDARCCALPEHVHAIVYPRDLETLDGQVLVNDSDELNPMYLDPFQTDRELNIEHLKSRLMAWGITDSSRYLRGASTRTIVLRTSRNILATVHDFRGLGAAGDDAIHSRIHQRSNPFADIDHAFYSALWANLMFCTDNRNSEPTSHVDLVQLVPLMLDRFETLYPMDAVLIERYVLPLCRSLTTADPWDLIERLRVARAGDSIPKQIRLRNKHTTPADIKFFVGQVFRHRRYNYTAVITGWDVECSMSSQWMAQNQVDRLACGRNQSFYHALVEDTSIRYVAEENVEIIQPDQPISLMSLAGRFFKRWDGLNHVFISNVRDEYPDD